MKKFDIIRLKGTDEEINQQWLALRHEGLGGSDMAPIMGKSPYRSAYSVWAEKTGLAEPDDISKKEAVYWGTVLEDAVANRFAQDHPDMKVARLNGVLRSCEWPWLQASLDRRVTLASGEHAILEIKTANAFAEKNWRNGVPEWYRLQVAHYLAVTGWSQAYIAVLIGGQEYHEYLLSAEDMKEDIDAVIDAADTFWNYNIKKNIQPLMQGVSDETATLLKLGNRHRTVTAYRPQYAKLVDDYLQAKDDMALAKMKLDAISNEMKSHLTNLESFETDRYTVKWGRTTRKVFDREKFDADHPGLYEEYQTVKDVNGPISIQQR